MSATHPARTLRNLRNTRDLRAEILLLAAELVTDRQGEGRLILVDPAISEATIRKEWDSLLPAIAPDARARMHLRVEKQQQSRVPDVMTVGKPNYRHEVLRLLIDADLRNEKISVKELIEQIETSQTPVRAALAALRSAGVVRQKGTKLQLRPEDLTGELLARIEALPETLRFRFEQGARIKPPAQLLQRCLSLLDSSTNNSAWRRMALSGVAAAMADVAALNIVGLPRLDLVAQMPSKAARFQPGLLKQLDDGLVHDKSILEAAPVVVTVVRARLMRAHHQGRLSMAPQSDVFLSLLDMGLREQARQYVRVVRQ